MRVKTIIMFVFIAFLAFSGPVLKADDFSDTLQITWEKYNTPYFNKYNAFGAGARAMGMGEAFTSLADDASAIYYNPAGLAQLDHNELYWTGGSLYGAAPYTGFTTFTLSLGGQYFALSYMKLYHPVGHYPDNISIPGGIGTGNILFPASDLIIPPGKYEQWYGDLEPAWQEFLADKYRKYINLPFQENQIMLTYATPLTSDRSFFFGLNVKYLFTDTDAKAVLGDDFDAWAWGLDLGFLYKMRIIEQLKDFNIGIMLRDVSGAIKRYKTGIENQLVFTSTIGLSLRTTELIQKEITSFSVDWDAVNSPSVLEAEKNRVKFGFEQWFLDGHFAMRSGLVYFLYPGPWRMTLGVSARYLLGLDYAYVRAIPFDQQAENEDESHWVSVYWMWGKTERKVPTPDVFAAVEPISFAPRNGETVIFKLNASSRAGMDRWVLNILDKNNNLIKSYVDVGHPPSQIVWNGTDTKYQLLPDGEYTFIFEATDKLGGTASTPVQTVKIYTPVLEAVNLSALEQLKALLKAIKDRDVAEDSATRQRATAEVAALKSSKEKPRPAAPPAAMNPYEPGFGVLPVSPAAGVMGEIGDINMVGFPNIDSGSIRAAYIATAPDGSRAFNMDYYTQNTMPKFVINEMAMMVKSISESLGGSVSQVAINSIYGGENSLSLTVPSAQAQNYTRGLISVDQMLRGSSVTLNGEAIYPNF